MLTAEIDRTDCIRAIRSLDPAVKSKGASRLEGIVASESDSVCFIIPSYR
ncbi:MAG TPA: hypothetical protein PLA83_00205 [Deltaproteobacteria bacterium]|nr:hypothetical protein [Deltaproteobacteria bacterium]